MDVGDVVAHMCVIDCALGCRFPRVVRSFVIWEHADNVDVFHILEGIFAGVDQFAPKNKVQALCHGETFVRVVLGISLWVWWHRLKTGSKGLMQLGTTCQNTRDLRDRIVETQSKVGRVSDKPAGFGNNQRAGGDVPFPAGA